MKKITLLFIFSIYTGGLFAQQQVNFVNNSNYDIFISYIITTDKSDTTGNHPSQLKSVSNGIVVPAGTTYSAFDGSSISPFKFPYNDFNGINQWRVSGQLNSISSTNVYNMSYAFDQKFYFAKVSTYNDPLSAGDGGSIGQNFGSSQSYISGTYVSFYFSAIHPDPSDPTWVIYNILAL